MIDKKKLRPERPIVTGISIDVLYPDGNSRTYTIDPQKTEALFWSDRAVTNILGKFYSEPKHQKIITKEMMETSFGKKKAGKILGRKPQVKLSPDVITKLWNEKDDKDFLAPYISKDIDCVPR